MADAPDLSSLVDRLAISGVEFILVGGMAAVAQGAPVTTFDVDIVLRRTGENVDRLMELLHDLSAHYRGRPPPPLPPDRNALLGPGHSLFTTDLGPLDVLGAIEHASGYDELLTDSIAVELSGRTVLVLSLEAMVRLKRGSTHVKDKLVLPILEATIRRQRHRPR